MLGVKKFSPAPRFFFPSPITTGTAATATTTTATALYYYYRYYYYRYYDHYSNHHTTTTNGGCQNIPARLPKLFYRALAPSPAQHCFGGEGRLLKKWKLVLVGAVVPRRLFVLFFCFVLFHGPVSNDPIPAAFSPTQWPHREWSTSPLFPSPPRPPHGLGTVLSTSSLSW